MTEGQKRMSGLAIASLVCGSLVFIVSRVSGLLGLTAILLGIIALVKISKNEDTLKGKGLAIGGITLAAIGIIVIPITIMLIARPNISRASLRANETSAIASLHIIAGASEFYRPVEGRYPERLEDLTYPEPAFITGDLATGTMDGYNFKLFDTNNDSTYLAIAVPVTKGDTGRRSFCVIEDGVVRFHAKGDNIVGYDNCKELEPAESVYK